VLDHSSGLSHGKRTCCEQVAGLAGIPQAVRRRAAEAGLHLEAKLQAAFDSDSGLGATAGTAAGAVTNGTRTVKQAAEAALSAQEADLMRRLTEVLHSPEQSTSSRGFAALETLWRDSQRLVAMQAS
jgi:hypothetical protein